MTTVVESSGDQVKAYTDGNGVFPVPPEVQADNEAQAKKAAEAKGTETLKPEAAKEEPAKEAPKDDEEGDDGLTEKQRREWTEQMRKTINKKHRAQKEAEELAASQYAERQLAQQRAEELAKENAELKARLAPKPEEGGPKEPQRADFKDDQAYWDALVDFRVDKKLYLERQAQAKADEEARQAKIVFDATARMEKAKELVEDYDDVVAEASYPVPTFVGAYMQESEMIAELGYHFAKHPEELERLGKITAGVREGSSEFRRAVTKQLVELGKIESRLTPFAKASKEAAKDDDGAKPSRETAPEPSNETGSTPSKPRTAPVIRPLNGGSAPQVERDESSMTSSQVITAWQRKHGVSLTARKRH